VNTLHSNLNRELERVLRSIVKVKNCYSYEVCSHRIEGQFGGEIMEQRFSEMNIYLLNAPKTQNYETIKEIVTKSYNLSKKINAGDPIKLRNYLFSDVNDGIKLINNDLLFRQNGDKEAFLKEISEFDAKDNGRILYRLQNNSKLIDENAALIFITDNKGCELSDALKMKYNKIKKQSVWIKINGDNIEIIQGLPSIEKE